MAAFKAIVKRSLCSSAELLELINANREVWWPDGLDLLIERTAEHDWVALPVASSETPPELISSIASLVAKLRIRNAWNGQ